jgi:hypothetical protein
MHQNWVGIKVRHRHGYEGVVTEAMVRAGVTALKISTTRGLEEMVMFSTARQDIGTDGWEWFDPDTPERPWQLLGSQNDLGSEHIKLSPREETLLVQIATAPRREMSKNIHDPCTRTINSLVRKGLVSPMMGGLMWRITPSGDVRVRSIY